MRNDWKPFGKPIHYGIIRWEHERDGIDTEGWIIAWRHHETALHGIEYLLPNGRSFGITPGDLIEFFV